MVNIQEHQNPKKGQTYEITNGAIHRSRNRHTGHDYFGVSS
jgi:hypothetical protein